MEPRLTDSLRVVFTFMILISTGLAENDREFCGTWRHGQGPLSLNLNLSTGCSKISISADQSVLSIDGQITAHCTRSEVIALKEIGVDSKEDIHFCLYWAPLLDQLMLQIGEKNLTLCWPASLQGSCCRYLEPGPDTHPEATYGIKDGIIKTDPGPVKTLTGYTLIGLQEDCKSLCDRQIQRSTQADMTEAKLRDARQMELHCPRRYDVDMEKVSKGYDVTLTTSKGEPAESATTVHLPPALQQAARDTSTVVCTFFTNNSLFQEGLQKVRVLDNVVAIDVVGSDVENEVIVNLSEPVKIGFHHDVIPKKHSRKCVSWDTRKDPLQVNWLADGCETRQRGDDHTECLCNHLTYFTVLVQMEPRPVRHLLALTAITSLGCAVSVISCIALIVYLCRKSRRCKEQSIPIHLGLAVSLAFLNLLFFFTGVLANVGGESVCVWVAAGLHYALLSSLTWMGIEVFHTFWLVYMVFTPSPKSYLWHVIGFALPAVPVVILAAVGDIYGLKEVAPSDDLHNPYRMCWMKDSHKALLAHYCTNMPLVAILVCSGVVMLFLVYRQIRSRDEWRQNRVAFLSIWGLSCLFGTTWGLTFLDFGPLSDFVLFLSCILNSFQGFLLMLRFYMLDWMRKQAGGSALGSSSTGSTRQHMLKAPEKS